MKKKLLIILSIIAIGLFTPSFTSQIYGQDNGDCAGNPARPGQDCFAVSCDKIPHFTQGSGTCRPHQGVPSYCCKDTGNDVGQNDRPAGAYCVGQDNSVCAKGLICSQQSKCATVVSVGNTCYTTATACEKGSYCVHPDFNANLGQPGVCQWGGTKDAPCFADSQCQSGLVCAKDVDVSSGQAWDTSNGICEPADYKTAGYKPPGAECKQGDHECEYGTFCGSDNKCQIVNGGQKCSQDSDCLDQTNYTCYKGYCVKKLSGNVDCTNNPNVCISPYTCSQDSQNPNKKSCQSFDGGPSTGNYTCDVTKGNRCDPGYKCSSQNGPGTCQGLSNGATCAGQDTYTCGVNANGQTMTCIKTGTDAAGKDKWQCEPPGYSNNPTNTPTPSSSNSCNTETASGEIGDCCSNSIQCAGKLVCTNNKCAKPGLGHDCTPISQGGEGCAQGTCQPCQGNSCPGNATNTCQTSTPGTSNGGTTQSYTCPQNTNSCPETHDCSQLELQNGYRTCTTSSGSTMCCTQQSVTVSTGSSGSTGISIDVCGQSIPVLGSSAGTGSTTGGSTGPNGTTTQPTNNGTFQFNNVPIFGGLGGLIGGLGGGSRSPIQPPAKPQPVGNRPQ